MVRRKSRVRISQRTTLAHWLISSGRSRWLLIQRWKASPMIVSEVGRTISGSSSLASGSGSSLPSIGPQPVVRDHRHLLGEALDVLGLLGEEAQAG